MLLWVAFGLLLTGSLIGAWCLFEALLSRGWPSSVNDASPSEVRVVCWSAVALVGSAGLVAAWEALR